MMNVLVGDHDRDLALNRLTDAYGEGRITEAEFEARQSQALAARTFDDLDQSLVRLPGPNALTASTMAGLRRQGSDARWHPDGIRRGVHRLRSGVRAHYGKVGALLGVTGAITLIASGALGGIELTKSAGARALDTALETNEDFSIGEPLTVRELRLWKSELQIAARPLKPTDEPGTLSVIEGHQGWRYYCVADDGVTCAALHPRRPTRTATAPAQASAQQRAKHLSE